jgi:hypothetical protein
LLTQGSDPSEVGRVQGLFGTGQTACTALAAAAAGAAFAVASWLPFVTVALVCSSGLGLAAVVWRSVPGRVGPIASDRSGPAGRSGRSTGQLPVAGAIGLSSEVQ